MAALQVQENKKHEKQHDIFGMYKLIEHLRCANLPDTSLKIMKHTLDNLAFEHDPISREDALNSIQEQLLLRLCNQSEGTDLLLSMIKFIFMHSCMSRLVQD